MGEAQGGKKNSANDSRCSGRYTNEVPPKHKSDVSPLEPTCHSQKVGHLCDTGFIREYPVTTLCKFYAAYSVHYDAVSNSPNTNIRAVQYYNLGVQYNLVHSSYTFRPYDQLPEDGEIITPKHVEDMQMTVGIYSRTVHLLVLHELFTE